MPSRFGVAAILLFWTATTALVGYREVWPRLFAGGPPPIRIDLADEATQMAATRWVVYRGDQRVGTLTTRMEYVPADDTFRFRNVYTNLTFDFGVAGVGIHVPRLETTVRITRGGDLREQHMGGTLQAQLKGLTVGQADARVDAEVVGGQLVGRVQLAKSPFGDLDRPLDPVPVRSGQVLNPMMPVNRLQDVRPGRRWVIREANPLGDALAALVREVAKQSDFAASALPSAGSRELLAEVLSGTEWVERTGEQPVECRVIVYRSDQEATARTWVSVADGRVMRQEAAGFGERLRFERED